MKRDRESIQIIKASEDAIIPIQAHDTDAGYDITIISLKKDYQNGVYLYDTGLIIAPESTDIYFEIYARSSLAKYGYMLANSVGIIDTEYRGSLMIQLYKFDTTAPDIKLPMRVAQMIPKRSVKIKLVEKSSIEDNSTERGTGGFGSTG